MDESSSVRQFVIPARLDCTEIRVLSTDPVRRMFVEGEQRLIDEAENDPLLRTFLDWAFSLDGVHPLEIPLTEEFRSFHPSQQEAILKAVEFRVILQRYIYDSYGVFSKLPSPSYKKQ